MANLRRLARAYAAWADARTLTEGEHDAAYEGTLSGVHVHIDTGVRESGAYAVVVRIAIACGMHDVLVKRGRDAREVEGDRVVRAARALVDERRMIRSVRLEEDAVEIRLDAGSDGEVIDDTVRRIADAWRSPGGAQVPFR